MDVGSVGDRRIPQEPQGAEKDASSSLRGQMVVEEDVLRELLASGRPVAGELLRQIALISPSRSLLGSHQEATDEALARLLDSAGLPDDEIHLFAARALMARGLQLTRESIEGLVRTLSRLGVTAEADFEAATYLKAGGLPITPSTLDLAKAGMRDPNGLGRQLHAVRTLLAMLAEAMEISSLREGLEVREAEQLVERAVRELSQRILLSEGEDRSRLVASLRRLAGDQGTSLEARLAAVMAGKTDARELESDLRVLLGRLVEMAQSIAVQTQEEGELQRLAALLRETVSDLSDGLQAQQLKNAIQQGPEQWFSLQLPFSEKPGDYPRAAELRISRKPGREIDPEQVRVVLRLEMERLKTVEVTLQIVGKQLTCSLASDSERAVPLLQGETNSLQSALEGLGYSVAPPSVGLLAQGGEAPSPSREVPDQLLRVDYRV